jgi:hypothetical protein
MTTARAQPWCGIAKLMSVGGSGGSAAAGPDLNQSLQINTQLTVSFMQSQLANAMHLKPKNRFKLVRTKLQGLFNAARVPVSWIDLDISPLLRYIYNRSFQFNSP